MKLVCSEHRMQGRYDNESGQLVVLERVDGFPD